MAMPNSGQSSNKAKIARRVVEVLEFFDDDHAEAKVMDIVRRYNRPQSSTSELLSSLVELGLLHKDPFARTYRLTPRAAMLGSAGQPEMVRDGRLVRLLDRLGAQTGHPVAMFSKVGLETQVVSWRSGHRSGPESRTEIYGGMKEVLSGNAPGWLMLSTLSPSRRDGTLRRLNAEAEDSAKFNVAEMAAQVAACGENKFAFGMAGFGSEADIVAALVPNQPEDHPLVVGIIHERSGSANREGLLQCIGDAMRQCLPDPDSSNVEKFPTAA